MTRVNDITLSGVGKRGLIAIVKTVVPKFPFFEVFLRDLSAFVPCCGIYLNLTLLHIS